MHIEARLIEIVGKAAQKLHTARSRNDQVVLDMRMYLRYETLNTIKRLVALVKVIVDFAKTHIDVMMPGYTHLQRAQPVLLSHHFMAYYEMFSRDIDRFNDGLKRIDVFPLGSAALAGTTYPIDREYTAQLLDFPKISANSIDAVSDRDFIIEFVSAASMCMVHLSRMSEEFILWSSSEFGFIELPDSFATGSSIMPQKRNPDVPELVRGKTGSIFGDLVSLLTMMKSLPLSYNRDMQEDKGALFRTADILAQCIDIYTKMIPRLKINREVMGRATSRGFLNATDMADYLVTGGMPFRQAHGCVGEVVAYASNKNKELHELTLKELKSFSSHFKKDVFSVLSTEEMINRRKSFGGTALECVKTAIDKAEKELKTQGKTKMD